MKPGLSEDGTKLIATEQSQVDQLAEGITLMAGPRPSTKEDYNGVDFPVGPFKVLLILRPTNDSPKPVQVQIGIQESDWRGWGKPMLGTGLSQGVVISEDGKVVSGFSTYADDPEGGEPTKVAFLFSQVVAALPYKDVEKALDDKYNRSKMIWKRTLEERRRKKMVARRTRSGK